MPSGGHNGGFQLEPVISTEITGVTETEDSDKMNTGVCVLVLDHVYFLNYC